MKLPNVEKAQIPEAKLREYLLSTTHTIGRYKARFLAGLGFTSENWTELRERLQSLARQDAELGEATEHGEKYLVSGTLEGPIGSAEVVSVWIVMAGDDFPRLVTVYPR